MMKETIYETPWVEMIFLNDDVITSSTNVEDNIELPEMGENPDVD